MRKYTYLSLIVITFACLAVLRFTVAGTDMVEMRYNATTKQCAQYVDCSQLYITGTAATTIKSQAAAAATSASPTFTGTVAIPTPFTIGEVSMTSTGTQLNYLANATGTTGTDSTNIVFSTSPTLVTPNIGVATATSVNKVAITAPASSATLTIADGKTATVSNTLTFTGTDSSTLNIGTGGTLGTAAYTAATAYATSAQGSTADSALPSASFTDAAVTGKLITGFISGSGAVAATDTILEAINKLDGNVALKANSADSSGVTKAAIYTVTSGDDSAGTKTITTGLSSIVAANVMILRSNATVYSDQVITISGGGLTIADGSSYALTDGDVIHWIAIGAL